MNMVVMLVDRNPEEPSLSMCLPPRLRRVRLTWASSSVALDACWRLGVLGVSCGALVNGVPWALVKRACGALFKGVPWALALAFACGVDLLLPDPRPVGVMACFAIEYDYCHNPDERKVRSQHQVDGHAQYVNGNGRTLPSRSNVPVLRMAFFEQLCQS